MANADIFLNENVRAKTCDELMMMTVKNKAINNAITMRSAPHTHTHTHWRAETRDCCLQTVQIELITVYRHGHTSKICRVHSMTRANSKAKRSLHMTGVGITLSLHSFCESCFMYILLKNLSPICKFSLRSICSAQAPDTFIVHCHAVMLNWMEHM